jgi:hypothetical protein
MFDYRRIALWLAVLLVPGGLLLLPMLIVDWRRRNANKQKPEQKAEAPVSHTLPPLAA